jgi:hypothetical protein
MYWSRTGSYLDILAWLVQCSLWWAGGWVISASVFRIRQRERLFTGLATGLLLYIVFSDLLAYVLPLTAALWGAAFLILTLGLIAAWRFNFRPRLDFHVLHNWPQILTFGGFSVLFVLINRGLAIFDDYLNLPLVSWMAAGHVPPDYYLNPGHALDYHYGLHLFAASLVRIGGFFPWSAFDLSKSVTVALTVVLAWLWLRRYTRPGLALSAMLLLVLFAGGTRWLLLLFPEKYVTHLGTGLEFMGTARVTGEDLYTALISPWKIEGGGPFSFPFAFTNGIFRPLSFAMGSNGALLHLTVILLLLLYQQRWRPIEGLVIGLVIASLALTGEHLFIMVWAGILLAALIGWRKGKSSQILSWGWVLLPGAALAPVMGGVLTGIARSVFTQITISSKESFQTLPGIGLRWPPAILSSHLGPLLLTNSSQTLIALFEIGTVLFLAPLVIWNALKNARCGRHHVMAGLSLGALIGFISSMFIQFAARDRDLSRMMDSALFIWLILGLPYLGLLLKNRSKPVQILVGACCVMAILGGIALLPAQLIAIAKPQPSFFVQEPDTILTKRYWNQLDQNVKIFDPTYPFRPTTLFARSTGPAYQDAYIKLPEFITLLKNPLPEKLAEAGYTHVYLDKQFWEMASSEIHQAFQTDCVKELFFQRFGIDDFRRFLDIKACR